MNMSIDREASCEGEHWATDEQRMEGPTSHQYMPRISGYPSLAQCSQRGSQCYFYETGILLLVASLGFSRNLQSQFPHIFHIHLPLASNTALTYQHRKGNEENLNTGMGKIGKL